MLVVSLSSVVCRKLTKWILLSVENSLSSSAALWQEDCPLGLLWMAMKDQA